MPEPSAVGAQKYFAPQPSLFYRFYGPMSAASSGRKESLICRFDLFYLFLSLPLFFSQQIWYQSQIPVNMRVSYYLFHKTKMAVAGFSSSTPLLPIFSREKYEWWSIKMKTLLRPQEIWDLVEHGFVHVLEPIIEEKERRRETKKNDAKALLIIQQAVHETNFSRIAASTTSKQAWSILQKEFLGDSKVITV